VRAHTLGDKTLGAVIGRVGDDVVGVSGRREKIEADLAAAAGVEPPPIRRQRRATSRRSFPGWRSPRTLPRRAPGDDHHAWLAGPFIRPRGEAVERDGSAVCGGGTLGIKVWQIGRQARLLGGLVSPVCP
jgi:hypothetical protein